MPRKERKTWAIGDAASPLVHQHSGCSFMRHLIQIGRPFWIVALLTVFSLNTLARAGSTGPIVNLNVMPPGNENAIYIDGLSPCDDATDGLIRFDSTRPISILVHGCRASAGSFKKLAGVFDFQGQQAVCFSYNDRNSLSDTADALAKAVVELAPHLESPDITLLGHSQGGLIARKALTIGRETQIAPDTMLKLVTVSAPLSGIRAARFCGIPLLRVITLGIHDLMCWAISGDKWYEITYASDYIKQPGALVPSVTSYLLVATDEKNTCRQFDVDGRCTEDDFVFTLGEQKLPFVKSNTDFEQIQIRAGHAAVVGADGVVPERLIEVLQERGFIYKTTISRRQEFEAMLASLYFGTVAKPSSLYP